MSIDVCESMLVSSCVCVMHVLKTLQSCYAMLPHVHSQTKCIWWTTRRRLSNLRHDITFQFMYVLVLLLLFLFYDVGGIKKREKNRNTQGCFKRTDRAGQSGKKKEGGGNPTNLRKTTLPLIIITNTNTPQQVKYIKKTIRRRTHLSLLVCSNLTWCSSSLAFDYMILTVFLKKKKKLESGRRRWTKRERWDGEKIKKKDELETFISSRILSLSLLHFSKNKSTRLL